MKPLTNNGAKSVTYWITTTLIAFAFISGGVAYLARLDAPVQGIVALGYPAYFVTILGAWKVLGGIAILTPRLARLKEWAYAGIVFDLSGVAFSHETVGDPTLKVFVPLLLLGIALASWALRPASRKLEGETVEPSTAKNSVQEILKVTA
jgi:uncharacterized membrane protein YphA (DoxX/SURF4 family)